jgi:hypothetical protein
MSTLQNTLQPVQPRLVALALIVALAAAALTAVLTASGGPGSAAPRGADAAVQRQYIGGPGEGWGISTAQPSAPANDGSQHSGPRP